MLRQTLWTSTLLALGSLVMLGANCEISATQAPTLCVFTAADVADSGATAASFDCSNPKTDDPKDLPSTLCVATITPESVIHVRHTLPEDVNPSGPLVLRVETPCGATTYEVPYADGIALWSSEAPAGAACSLTITAILDNSELRCAIHTADASTCTEACPKEAGP